MTKKTRYFMAGSAAILVTGLGSGLVAYYGGGFPSLSASRSGPAELSYVPADATVVAFANVRDVMDSQLRQHLKQALPQENGQKEFEQETGIAIERDIDSVVAAMTASPAGLNNSNGLVVARGRFNTVQLEAFARAHGGVVSDYNGKRLITVSEIHTGTDETPVKLNGHSMTLAFLEPGLVGIGSDQAIKTSIDAEMSAHSITSNADMMELVSDIDRYNNAWVVGRFDVIANQAKIPAEIRSHIPPVKTFAVMAHIDDGISGTLRAEAADDASAENLRQVVQGFLAMGRLSAQNDPRAAAVLQSLQLSGTGKTVALSFSVPAEVINMLPIKGIPDGVHQPSLPRELHELKKR